MSLPTSTPALDRRGCGRMILKTATIFLWLATSYLALVFLSTTWWETLLLAASVAFAMAGVGFCASRTTATTALTRRATGSTRLRRCRSTPRRVRVLLAPANAHHSFPNVTGSDDDFNVGAGAPVAARQAPPAAPLPAHLHLGPLRAAGHRVADDGRLPHDDEVRRGRHVLRAAAAGSRSTSGSARRSLRLRLRDPAAAPRRLGRRRTYLFTGVILGRRSRRCSSSSRTGAGGRSPPGRSARARWTTTTSRTRSRRRSTSRAAIAS